MPLATAGWEQRTVTTRRSTMTVMVMGPTSAGPWQVSIMVLLRMPPFTQVTQNKKSLRQIPALIAFAKIVAVAVLVAIVAASVGLPASMPVSRIDDLPPIQMKRTLECDLIRLIGQEFELSHSFDRERIGADVGLDMLALIAVGEAAGFRGRG